MLMTRRHVKAGAFVLLALAVCATDVAAVIGYDYQGMEQKVEAPRISPEDPEMKEKYLAQIKHARTQIKGCAEKQSYNGVCLQAPWPPTGAQRVQNVDPSQWPFVEPADPVTPPYLAQPEDTVSTRIHVGRQLFVDSRLIHSTDPAIQRIEHQAQFLDVAIDGPDKDLGEEMVSPYAGGVYWDPWEQRYRMWYKCHHVCVCHAHSIDTKTWVRERIDADVANEEWIAQNKPASAVFCFEDKDRIENIDTFVVFPDYDEAASLLRYKMAVYPVHEVVELYFRGKEAKRTAPSTMMLYTSPDGYVWRHRGETGITQDRSGFGYNPFRGVWSWNIKENIFHVLRSYRYYESKQWGPSTWPSTCMDLDKWLAQPFTCLMTYVGQPVEFITSDTMDRENPSRDPMKGVPARNRQRPLYDADGNIQVGAGYRFTDIYSIDTTPYESVMVSFFSMWYSNRRPPKDIRTQIGFSRDGFHYQRSLDRSVDFIGGTNDTALWREFFPVGGGFVVHNDRLIFLVKAYLSDPRYEYKWDETFHGLDYDRYQVLRFDLRRDGFVSLRDAAGSDDDTGSTITTTLLDRAGFAARDLYLFLNTAVIPRQSDADADVDGWIRVELLDAKDDQVVLAESEIMRGIDSTKVVVPWRMQKDAQQHDVLDAAQGDVLQLVPQLFRLRFTLHNCDLYSFWLADNSTGHSNGYLAGGSSSVDNGFQDVDLRPPPTRFTVLPDEVTSAWIERVQLFEVALIGFTVAIVSFTIITHRRRAADVRKSAVYIPLEKVV